MDHARETADFARSVAVERTPLPRVLVRPVEHCGRALLLGYAILVGIRRPRRWMRRFAEEAHRQITSSLLLVALVSVAGGALIAQQTGYQFQGNLPSWVVGSIVAASTVTEITPIFAALVLVGIVGTRIAAEIGVMRVTEQIDALEVMGHDPVAHLVVPRVLAGTIVTPLLMPFALAAAILAGWAATVLLTSATSEDFWFGVRHYMRDFPLFFAVLKGAVFGFGITFIASYAGLQARGGSAGVGVAARKAVVGMIVGIILLDAALAPLIKWIRV